MLKNICLKLRDHLFRRILFPRFLRREIRPGDIVIDCGANIGEFTDLFARYGAVVHAFEPHPIAFEKLRQRFEGTPNVHCYNQAVSNLQGTLPLFLRTDDSDPIGAIESSSIMPEKDNVSKENFINVEVIRFVDFISKFDRIKIIKMDIEGAEYKVIPDTINSGASLKVDHFLVETHERLPGFKEMHDALVRLIATKKATNFDLTWH